MDDLLNAAGCEWTASSRLEQVSIIGMCVEMASQNESEAGWEQDGNDDILTITELSKWLQIHPDILMQLADKNNPKLQLPSVRGVGDRLLFRRGAVKAWCTKAREFNY